MQVEWDGNKDRETLRKRGIGFNDAVTALGDKIDEWKDARHDYGEDRFVARCRFRGRVVIVVYTKRGETIRIISIRNANKRETRDLS